MRNMKTKLQKLGLVLVMLLLGMFGVMNGQVVKVQKPDSISVTKITRHDSTFLKVYVYLDNSYTQYDSVKISIGDGQGQTNIFSATGKVSGGSDCYPYGNLGHIDMGIYGTKCLGEKYDTTWTPYYYYVWGYAAKFEIPVPTFSNDKVASVLIKLANGSYVEPKYFFFDMTTGMIEYPKNINSVIKYGDNIKVTFGENSNTALVNLYDLSGSLLKMESVSGIQQGTSHSITTNFNQGFTIVTVQTEQNINRYVVY